MSETKNVKPSNNKKPPTPYALPNSAILIVRHSKNFKDFNKLSETGLFKDLDTLNGLKFKSEPRAGFTAQSVASSSEDTSEPVFEVSRTTFETPTTGHNQVSYLTIAQQPDATGDIQEDIVALQQRMRRYAALSDDYVIEGGSLNWFVGSAPPQHMPGGGPGALPVEAQVNGAVPRYQLIEKYRFDAMWQLWIDSVWKRYQKETGYNVLWGGLTNTFEYMLRYERYQRAQKIWDFIAEREHKNGDSPTHVIVLDTMPSEAQIQAAQASAQQPTSGYNPYTALFGADGVAGKLSFADDTNSCVPSASDLTTQDGEPIILTGHPYNLSDHGTFIAGIINSIAPNVNIHLIKVLNDNGVGTLQGFLCGLEKAVAYIKEVRATQPDTRFVINCSLTFTAPNTEAEAAIAGYTLEEVKKQLNDLLKPFQPDLQPDSDVLFVAAAGNESREGVRKPARFPAALQNVVGVGALKRGNTPDQVSPPPASYSNISDTFTDQFEQITEQGIAIFGGEVLQDSLVANAAAGTDDSPPAPITDAQNGVFGVYTSHDPIPPANADTPGTSITSGYAYWAGTSFATGAVSGLLAQLLNHGKTPKEALAMIYELHPGPAPGIEQIGILEQR